MALLTPFKKQSRLRHQQARRAAATKPEMCENETELMHCQDLLTVTPHALPGTKGTCWTLLPRTPRAKQWGRGQEMMR